MIYFVMVSERHEDPATPRQRITGSSGCLTPSSIQAMISARSRWRLGIVSSTAAVAEMHRRSIRLDWVTFAAQWLHVFLGIVWFGYSLALAIFFIPAISHLPITTQREIGASLTKRAVPIIDVIAPAILILGVIRGTLLGPIDSVGEVFTTAYGLTWLVAAVMLVLVFSWSRFVIVPLSSA
jgi:hypothetical protein